MRRRNGQSGFTIIEAVVATGVFAFVVASSLGVYMAVMQLDSKNRAERSVQQNARFIMDYLAKEIRNGSINYAGTNNSTTLSLINQENVQEVFQYNPSTDILTLTKSGLGTTNLNSSDVVITNMWFNLHPDTDPFVLANDVHVQPYVSVTMEITSTNPKVVESAVMTIQSTFAVREYPSRD